MISKKYTAIYILIVFILTKFILQYILIHPVYELHRDEYLHLDQAKHLAWGYVSVPPLTSWNSYVILLLGNSEFWIKFFPALYGALTIVVVWFSIKELKGNLFALVLGSTCILLSVLLRINLLYQPNSLEILLWTLFYFLFLRFIHTNNVRWLYMLAIVTAFGFLNKYNIAFLLLGFLPAVLLTRHRTIFLNRHLYYAILIALIIILPNLVWQYQNDFPVIKHLNVLASTQLVNVNRADFIKEQILFFLGGIVVLISGFFALIFYRPFNEYRVYLFSFIFTIIIFIFLKAKGYYAIGLYPVLIAFGSVYLERILQNNWQQYLKPVMLLIPMFLSITLFKIAFPNKTPEQIRAHPKAYEKFGLLRWEDGKDHALPQDFADMLGWKELANKVDKAYASLPPDEYVFVLCDNYGQAGAINYYSANKKIGAVSMNADYRNWFKLERPIQHVILVQDLTDSDKQREKEKPLFDNVFAFDSITNTYAREKGTIIYVLKNAKADINSILKNDLSDKNNH
jgi:4-amino-4-deoxy-L-arabinose transferase-like glycosyltransferase